jgi:hypothetical protein
MVSRRWGKA